ncbi:phage portal protein [Paenalcaligenes sp. Me131]|uniref:phage portal protein n=1 Tax=Paenalcaligenes sp. Me131 TaxID=3392636 RepID=UPI003D29D2C2
MLFRRATDSGQGGSGWLSGFLGGVRSAAGQDVNAKSAMAIPVLQNCVSLLAESIAQLPVELYRRLPNGGREAATDHPLYKILKYRPNPWQTSFEYREFSQMSAGLRGNSYSYIERDGGGVITGLYPMDPDNITVWKGSDLCPYYQIAGSDERLPQRYFHHVRWMSFDNYVGASPIALHANAIGYSLALSEYAAKSFVNGTALSGVLERPKDSGAIKDQKIIDDITTSWQARFGGSPNSNKVAFLQEGMTFKPLSMSNVDADLIKALTLTGVDVARIWKIPLPMLAVMEGATLNNVENLQIQFVIYGLLPWIKRHESAMQRDFLRLDEMDELYIEFNIGGLLRGNQEARYKAYAIARQWGWLSVNDIRKLENLPPIPGGDVYLQPLNMVDAATGIPTNKDEAKALAEIHKALQ